jgi:hypothetical protein
MMGWLFAHGQYPAGQVPPVLGRGPWAKAIAKMPSISSAEIIFFMASV